MECGVGSSSKREGGQWVDLSLKFMVEQSLIFQTGRMFNDSSLLSGYWLSHKIQQGPVLMLMPGDGSCFGHQRLLAFSVRGYTLTR